MQFHHRDVTDGKKCDVCIAADNALTTTDEQTSQNTKWNPLNQIDVCDVVK